MSSSAYQRSTDVGHDAAILVGMHDPHEDDPDVRRFNRGIGGTGARKMLGILTLVTAVVAVTAALTWYGLSLHDRTQSTLASSPLDNDTGEKSQGVIQDSTDLDLGYDDDIGDDDDTKSNPEVYPDRKCRQLSWSVQNNLIHDGSKAIPIKGISWYGFIRTLELSICVHRFSSIHCNIHIYSAIFTAIFTHQCKHPLGTAWN